MRKKDNEKPLTAVTVKALNAPGMHADKGQRGLYLQVTENGLSSPKKSWIFRFSSPTKNKRREMGLGPISDRTLAEARLEVQELRKKVLAGVDPIDERRQSRLEARRMRASDLTFKNAAEQFIATKKAEWTNAKHAAQWSSTLETYAFPKIGERSVRDVTTDEVLQVLLPIWTTKTETATRVRQRIEAVFDWAIARGTRTNPNPATLKGNLAQLLPLASKVKKVRHHPALPYSQAPKFFAALKKVNGVSALALRFLIFTAARTSEVTGATWGEINFQDKVWTIPANRMKAKREHRVPLSGPAIKLLQSLTKDRPKAPAEDELIFPNPQGRSLSNVAMLKCMRDMRKPFNDFVPHGLRSTFRDWGSEQTDTPNEVLESALAHTIRNRTEAAYRRGDLLEKRRVLMSQWSSYLDG
jgi:integrase